MSELKDKVPTPQSTKTEEKKPEMRIVFSAPAYRNKTRYQAGDQIVLTKDVDFVPSYMVPIGWEPTKIKELKDKQKKK